MVAQLLKPAPRKPDHHAAFHVDAERGIGGIGWGVPETMGETMARSGLGQEYNRILVSLSG